ncbi:unnamed protein product [Triticum turgidum subsp. durum]|uniref:chitinase n=1 Tax=Triticum turgidum subsp. durum TaxID=4567 RepID=A0A9R1PTM2_TRITD|nr:unnamed protein product [Triticum turgidum subsp. durum]
MAMLPFLVLGVAALVLSAAGMVAAQNFYTRRSFLAGARANPNFGKGRTGDDGKREIAAFFAHKVAQDPEVAFKAALWFWMNNVKQVLPRGFGATTRAINSGECNGGNTAAMNARAGYYRAYCKQFGVDPGSSLTC